MKAKFYLTGVIFFLFAIGLPVAIHSQQNGSVRRQPTTPTDPSTSASAAGSRPRVNSVTSAMVKTDLSEALSVIENNYVDGKKLDYNSVFKSSISGMLTALDPHSTYFDPVEFATFKTEQRSEYFGIGATIGDLHQGEDVSTHIRATFEDAPAQRAGLRFGDRIVAVDGQSMKGKTYPEVRKFLLGPRGTMVKVTVEHPSTGKTESVTITRDAVSLPSVPQAYMLRPGVGYVSMTGFNLTTSAEFQAALEDLHKRGMNTLILDLRGNRGGLLIQAVRVANTFLQRPQLIVKQQGRIRGANETFPALNDNPDPIPLVVLVNGESASAAEIVAGALQDHDRALIVGENTFGKGLVQLPIQLEYDSALLLTIAKYFTPSGRLIQRDYSNSGFYDYYTRGGISANREPTTQPAGPETHTDVGRTVYGGGGIAPDEPVKPGKVTPAEARLTDSIFAFALELTSGRVAGFENYKVDKPIEYGHDLQSTDFPVTEALMKEFKKFVVAKSVFKVTPEQLERARPFVERQLRYDLTTAAYGTTTALQVINERDPQIARAVDALPRARELAQAARRAKARS
ncbi:MAG: S41 family peptidase [Acidobacteriota bacterium]|nr:S41 family peptidase [Acidobacteriota bacterium]